MNAREGLRRVARVVRWVGAALAFGCVLLAGATALDLYRYGTWADLALSVGAPLLAAAAAYGVAHALGWIIEGFAADA